MYPLKAKAKQAKAQSKAHRNALISGVFDISVKFRQSEFVDAVAPTRRKRNVL
jgi:hypothetical protein